MPHVDLGTIKAYPDTILDLCICFRSITERPAAVSTSSILYKTKETHNTVK